MDSMVEIRETKSELQETISRQRAAMDGSTVNGIMSTDAFSIERLEKERIGGWMGFKHQLKLSGYRFRERRYQSVLSNSEKIKIRRLGELHTIEK